MSTYTYATCILADADLAAAREKFGSGYFPTPLSADGAEPATHWMGSGPWDNSELDYMVNESGWSFQMYFGQDWQAALTAAGLQVVQVVEPPAEELIGG